QRRFLLDFILAGAAGKTVKARSQWQRKQSWRQTAPNPAREEELHRGLASETSHGLIGEISIHQLDNIAWFLNAHPTAVTGFGSTILWSDGRSVPDSVLSVYEFGSGAHACCEATLGNSFDAEYEMLYGTDAAVMLRGNKAWMFKEVDAPLLGWEVYAKKDEFYKETGIALASNATKLVAQGNKPVEEAPYADTPLFYALKSFITNTGAIAGGVEDFIANFGDKPGPLKEYLATLEKDREPPAPAHQ